MRAKQFCVLTNGDREGLIFLSHPQTISGFFVLLTTKLYLILYKKNIKKDFKKIVNTLRCDESTCGWHAADLRLFVYFYLYHGYVR